MKNPKPRRERSETWLIPSGSLPVLPDISVISRLEKEIRSLRAERVELERGLLEARVGELKAKFELGDSVRRGWQLERENFRLSGELVKRFEEAPLPMSLLDLDGVVVSVNECQLEMLGCERSELIGRSFGSFFSEAGVVEEILGRVSAGEESGGVRAEFSGGEGESVPVLVNFALFDDGTVRGICCVVLDLRRAGAEDEDAERAWVEAIGNVPNVLWLCSVEPEEVLFSSERWGVVSEGRGESFWREPDAFLEMVPEADWPVVTDHFERRKKEACEAEFRVFDGDRVLCWIRERTFPLCGADGKPERFLAFAEEITEFRRRGDQLKVLLKQHEVLARFSLRFFEGLSLGSIFREAVVLLSEMPGVDAVGIWEFDRKSGGFRLKAGVGFGEGEEPDCGSDSGAGFAIGREEPVLVEDFRKEERFRPAEFLLERGIVGGILARIPGSSEPYGVLAVYSDLAREFSVEEREFVRIFANRIGGAVSRRRAEEEFAKVRERFDGLMRNVPAVIWEARHDPETGEFVPGYISEGAADLVPGFSREGWVRRGELLWGVHPDDKEEVLENIRRAFSGGEPAPAEFRWVSEAGKLIWLESHKRPVYGKGGVPVGVRGILIDVTERKKVEQERREADERIGDILANVPGVVWEMRIDPMSGELRMIFVNDFIEQLSGGYTKEEFLAEPDFWIKHVHVEERDSVRGDFEELLRGRFSPFGLIRWVRKDGKVIWIETNQRIVRNSDGKAIGLRGITVDVTARKRAEMERDDALRRFNAFMDNGPFVAAIKDQELRYIYGNRLFAKVCAERKVEWKGRRPHEICPDKRNMHFEARNLEVLEKREATHSIEMVPGFLGEPGYWSTIRFPIFEKDGTVSLGTIAIDVTDRIRLEREILEISDHEQERLGQELHDGLCQHLLGLALMGRSLAGRMEQREIPEAAEVWKLTGFANEALELARGMMQGFHLIKTDGPDALVRVLEGFLKTTGQLFGRNLKLEKEVSFEVLDHNVGSHLFRIAQEATHNAIKHADPSVVCVRLGRIGENFLLAVENDGKSLPEESERHSGVGMETMRYRADLIGATLSFENRAGGGTIVSCRLQEGLGIRFLD